MVLNGENCFSNFFKMQILRNITSFFLLCFFCFNNSNGINWLLALTNNNFDPTKCQKLEVNFKKNTWEDPFKSLKKL